LRLREVALDALARLLAQHRDGGALEEAVQVALRLIALDPLQEPVHRTLMRLYTQLGRRGAALRQYQFCVAALQRELRAEPDDETRALYQQILQRRPVPGSSAPARAHGPSPAGATAEGVLHAGALTPETPLVGRGVELAQLRSALK